MVDYELCGKRVSILLEVIRKNEKEDKDRRDAYYAACLKKKEGKAS